MASFRQTAKGWRAEIYIQGHRESKVLPSKAKANAWAAKRETEIREGNKADPGIMTLADLMNRYLKVITPRKGSAKSERHRLERWIKEDWTQISLKALNSGHIASWRDDRLEAKTRWGDPVSSSTVSREMNTIKAVLSAGVEWGLLNSSPAKGVKKPKESRPRNRLLTEDEIERLCLAMGWDDKPPKRVSERVAAAFLLALETGMRAGELCSLGPDSVDLDRRVATLTKTKNGSSREVPLSSEAVRILKLCDCDLGLKPPQLDANFRKYRNICGIEDLHFHDTRHHAITQLSKKLDVLALARMVGHSDIRQLQAYYNESAEDIAKLLG